MIKEYSIKPHQKEMIDEVQKLNPNRLYYVVIQQDKDNNNLTLNELKRHLKTSIKRYVRDFFSMEYRTNLENELIKYVCFFEYSKEFSQSLYLENIRTDEVYMGTHFHLFVSSNNSQVHIPQLIQYIYWNLTSQPIKARAIKFFDYKKLDSLEERFIQYHTKQHHKEFNSNMFMKNL
jgi:hypothetical protein